MVSRRPIATRRRASRASPLEPVEESTMTIRTAVTRLAFGVCAAAAVAAITTAPVSTQQPPFSATITMTGDAEVCVGEVGNVFVDWSTNRDVTRSQWSVGASIEPEQAVSGSSGSDSRTFSSTETGLFQIEFALRHHMQSDRVASESFAVTVSACADEDCDAAPAVANAYLDELAYEGGRGWINSSVAAAMSAGQFGDDKCDLSYADLVRAFVDGLLGQ
jgi:hypothetical protein